MNFLSKSKSKIIWTTLLIIFLVSIYFNYQYFRNLKTPQEDIAKSEITKTIEQVSKLVVLPTDEFPTVATVTDPKALQSQRFFLNAEKDDKVLIYSNAKKAILFRPSQNKIVEIAPINKGESASSTTTNATPISTTSTKISTSTRSIIKK